MSSRGGNSERQGAATESNESSDFHVERADEGIILMYATEPDAPPAPQQSVGVEPVKRVAPRVEKTISVASGVPETLISTSVLARKARKNDVATRHEPPEVEPPAGFVWSSEPGAGGSRRFGSATHPGPADIAQDKGNQDFAFHLEVGGPNETHWVLCGVADGVGQGTWSARAARHAAAAFIEAVGKFLVTSHCPRNESELRDDSWSHVLADSIYTHIQQRLEHDAAFLRREKFVDPTWDAREYVRHFIDDADAETAIRAKWFQTTLLAAALGPYGGFALFMGDGYVRIDRQLPGGEWTSSAGLTPTPPITMGIVEPQVRASLNRLLPRGARCIGVLMTTDGVSNSTATALERAFDASAMLDGGSDKPPLERVRFASSDECMRALERLAAMPPELADRDNMSVAFGACDLVTVENR